MDALDHTISNRGADAYLMYASSDDADMRYLSGFKTSDPFVYFKKVGRRGTIIVSQMEYARAMRESAVAVMTRAEAGLGDILNQEKNPWQAAAKMIAGQVQGTILVPPRFPLALARALSESVNVVVDETGLESLRAVKTHREIGQIKNVQKIAQRAMDLGISLIEKSTVKKGRLIFDGAPLTSEQVRTAMHKHLMDNACRAGDTIVSCGEDTAIPHCTGSGPLRAGQPIVIDIFPQDERSGYCSDITRTVSKGEPDRQIAEMYAAVRDARELAIAKVRSGILGADIHQAVVDFFKDHGYESTTKGFVHNLGHGVGLQVHEPPVIGPSGTALVAGNVITIEPGLYYPGTGGVRLEDLGAVTSKGFNRFTNFPAVLVL